MRQDILVLLYYYGLVTKTVYFRNRHMFLELTMFICFGCQFLAITCTRMPHVPGAYHVYLFWLCSFQHLFLAFPCLFVLYEILPYVPSQTMFICFGCQFLVISRQYVPSLTMFICFDPHVSALSLKTTLHRRVLNKP